MALFSYLIVFHFKVPSKLMAMRAFCKAKFKIRDYFHKNNKFRHFPRKKGNSAKFRAEG